MEYILSAAVALLAVFFFCKMLMPSSNPEITMPVSIDSGQILSGLAQQKNVKPHGSGVSTKKLIRILKRQYTAVTTSTRQLLPFEQWLCDNYAYLSARAKEQRHNRVRYMRLPSVGGSPRLYKICQTIVQANDGKIDDNTVTKAVAEFHKDGILTYDEICAFSDMLAFALLEYCAAFATQSIRLERIFRKVTADARRHRIDTDRIADGAYLYYLTDAIADGERKVLEKLCLDNGLSPAEQKMKVALEWAHWNGLIANAISGLRRLPALFSAEFTLSLSKIDRMFCREQVQGYTKSSLQTRYYYCRRVSQLARRRKTGELSVAAQVIAVCAEKRQDIAFALLDSPKGKTAMLIYIFLQWVCVLALPVPLPFFFGPWGILGYFVAIPIAFGLTVTLFADVVRFVFPRRFLPRIDLERCTENEYSTLLAVPTLVGSAEEVKDAFGNLETLAYANPNKRFRYGILFDLLPNRTGPVKSDDAVILNAIISAYQSFSMRDRCFVLVRARKKNGDGVYCGWEKKRGALIELNTLLLTGNIEEGHTMLGIVPKVDYVITLDSDTMINCADELVSMMAHPYNADVHVIGLSMRTNPTSAAQTGFSRLFSGAIGLHAYSQTLSDPANDLFGHGNFTGKGIYRVKEFHQLTGAAFCPDSLLSHDFIEGAVAGYRDSDLFGMDNYPADYSAYLTRKLRWLRGDLQFLPFLKPKMRNMAGEYVKNPLTPIDKHHIVTVSVLAFLPTASFTLFILSLFISPFLLIPAFALPIVAVLSSVRRSALNRNFDFIGETARQLFMIAVLPTEVQYSLHAFFVTIIRLHRRKHLMEWKVSAHYKGRIRLWLCPIIGVATITVAALLAANPIYYGFGALFVAAYGLDAILRRNRMRKTRHSPAFDALLMQEARATWNYFSAQLTEANSYLPCDNYSVTAERWTTRTSPTDIGMALLSVVAACNLQIIPKEQGESLAAHMIDSIEQAPKWRGHLYNWMTVDLQPMEPQYVSTVDSGNLLACLSVAANYFTSLHDRLHTIMDQIDMAALLDRNRGLFYIGYNVSTDQYDPHHYDLAGSECTTAYLLSIGMGKIPRRIWNNLSRSTVRYAGKMLYSWTGGMFEYLLNAVFFEYPKNGLFGKTAQNVVRSHIGYAKQKRLPFWGISECQYTESDTDGQYAYQAFGVPNIALNGRDCTVTAPYACLLAAGYAPTEVERNLRRLIDAGARGEYGFYESMRENKPVKSYMSHHKGMTLAAICNYLCEGVLWRLMTADGIGRAAELLLSEPADFGRSSRKTSIAPIPTRPDPIYSVAVAGGVPQYVFLSVGSYCAVLDGMMHGYAYMDGYLTAFDRADGLLMRLQVGNTVFSPTAVRFSHYDAEYADDTSVAAVTCTVAVEPYGERRTVWFKNKTNSIQTATLVAEVRPDDCITALPSDNIEIQYMGNRSDRVLGFRLIDGKTICTHKDGETVLIGQWKYDIPPHGQIETSVRLCAGYTVDAVRDALNETMSEGERYARGFLFAPQPTTSYIGSRLLSGLGSTLPDDESNLLPCVVLDADDEHLETKFSELCKLYRYGVPFETAVTGPTSDSVAGYERIRLMERKTGIDRFCSVHSIDTASVTDWQMPPRCSYPVKAVEHKKLRPIALELPSDQTENSFRIGSVDLLENSRKKFCITDGRAAVYGTRRGISKTVCTVPLLADDRLPAVFFTVGDADTFWPIEPLADDGAARSVTLSNRSTCRYRCGGNGLVSTHTAYPLYGQNAIMHAVTVQNLHKRTRKIRILGAFHPAVPRSRLHRLQWTSDENSLAVYDRVGDYTCVITTDLPIVEHAFFREGYCFDTHVVRIARLGQDGTDLAPACAVDITVAGESEQTVHFTVGTMKTEINGSLEFPQPMLGAKIGIPAVDMLFDALPQYAYRLSAEKKDALSDSLALCYLDPEYARAVLVEIASEQCVDGTLDGDLCATVLLPIGVCNYISFTADKSILDERAPFVQENTSIRIDLRERCLRALFGYAQARTDGDPIADMLFLIAVMQFMSYCTDARLRLRLSDCKKRVSDSLEKCWNGECYKTTASQDDFVLIQALSVWCMTPRRARCAVLTAYKQLTDATDIPFNLATVAELRALYAIEEPEIAFRLLNAINPLNRTTTDGDPWIGNADRSAAAQLYCCLIQDMLGVQFGGQTVTFAPKLPKAVKTATLKFQTPRHTVKIDNRGNGRSFVLSVDGIRYNTNQLQLHNSIRGKVTALVRSEN